MLRLLAERGHQLHLVAERDETLGGVALVEQLAAEYPAVTFGEAPRREQDEWAPLVTRLRLAFDYLRYLEPMYDGAPRLRRRAVERVPAFAARFGDSGWSRRRPARSLLRTVLRSAERAVPLSASITGFLREQRPDVMVITPLIGVVGSPQPDYVLAARALGIPTALSVWSWDHLSSKALIRDVPDRVVVWNELQRDEAMRLHGVPASRIVVTGAQCFDQWFGRQPSRSRAAFCQQVGLPADRPFVLYAGSALFGGSPSEAAFVLQWIARIRASQDPRLREAAILVRPHPQRMAEWEGVDLSTQRDVVVWGGNPVTERARADYFDSLYYSAAVVGLNTSAFLEAAIAGRPVLAIMPAEFRDNQEGTIHFHYLTGANGVLQTSRDFDEHLQQLAAAIDTAPDPKAHAAFLREFIRPRGLDVAAAPVFADAVEALAIARPATGTHGAPLLGRTALAAWRRLAASPRHRWLVMDAEDRRVEAWRQEKATARAARRRAGLGAAAADAEAERRMRERRSES